MQIHEISSCIVMLTTQMQEWTVLVTLLDQFEETLETDLRNLPEAGADRLKLIFDASIMDPTDLKSLRDELEEKGREPQTLSHALPHLSMAHCVSLSMHNLRVWHDLIHTMKNMTIALSEEQEERGREIV